MSSANRTLLALCLAATVNLSPLLEAHAAAAAPAAAGLPEWPQAHSDLVADPDVRFGALPNGMRYAIMKNATPAGQVSLRLRIGAGSLEERADQQGLAHFLEHMAFRGSRRFPDQEVKRSLERLGLKFGPDTNAFTGFTETVFLFDLPKNDAASVDTGLSFMREIGDGLTLNAKLFDAERGVVLSEARLRDTPATHMSDAQQDFLFKDQLVSQRMPIGKTSIIEHAPVSLVRDYYRTWYRPDNATLVIVGDIDPVAIEAKLRSRFASWHAGTTQPKRPDYGTPLQRGAQARVFTESGAPTVTSLNWMAPFDTSGDSIAREQQELIEQLALAALNRRLQVAAAAADRSFTSAGLYRANMLHSGKITTLLVQHEPAKWRVALAQADELRRQAAEQGLTQEEVNREIAGFLAEVETAQKGAATRVTPQLANLLVRSVDDDEVFTSPDLDLDLVQQTLVGLSADKVNAALRGVFAGNGPLAFSAGPQDIAGGDATLLTALDQSEHSTLPEAAQATDIAWPYRNFGAPGKVVEQRQSDALDTTLVKFANGVRLNIHPTTFRKDQVLVQVRIGNGRLAMSKQKPSLAWAANVGAFIRGGLGKLDFQTAQRALTGKIYSSSFQVGDDALTFGGQTRPADLDTQLQVLAAYVTDPGLRPEALAQIQASLLPQLAQINAVPGNLFQVQLASYLHGGDPRWAFPPPADIQGATPEALQALLKPELASGPIEITVVGDTTIDTAIAAVARTFGAIPGHNTATRMKASKSETTFPAHTKTPVILEHQGGADQGLAAVAWPTTDGFADIKSDAARQLLADVLQQRLFETLRLQDGESYSTPAQSQYSTVFPGYGVIIAYADIPPSKSQLFFDAEHRISAELRAHPVSADELERVRAPAVANSAKSRQTNDYWAYWLSAIQSEPRVEGLIAQNLDNLRTVTAADLQKAANTWLRDDTRWEMVVQPAAKPAAAPAADPVTK